jgi:cytochrome c peroxidase
MHDGSLNTLEDVVEFYSQGGRRNPYLDSEIGVLKLNDQEKIALAAFLRSLSGELQEGMR